jgi:hypothetical protein
MKTIDTVIALAPASGALEPEWAQATLESILAEPSRPTRRSRGRKIAAAGAAAVTLFAGAAVAAGGPVAVVKDVLQGFADEPGTTGNGLGVLHDPELVAKFSTPHGIFAFWVATSSSGTVCFAYSDGTWDGTGSPTKSELDYGCGGGVVTGPSTSAPLTRPEQLGGFFKDESPMIYGIAPYADAVRARVEGVGVDRTLPVRADSHGYGAALPEAARAKEVTVTYLDAAGRELGVRTLVAPVG